MAAWRFLIVFESTQVQLLLRVLLRDILVAWLVAIVSVDGGELLLWARSSLIDVQLYLLSAKPMVCPRYAFNLSLIRQLGILGS